MDLAERSGIESWGSLGVDAMSKSVRTKAKEVVKAFDSSDSDGDGAGS